MLVLSDIKQRECTDMLFALWAFAAAGIAVLIWGLYEIIVNDAILAG